MGSKLTATFRGELCKVTFGRYASTNRTMIQLWTADGEPMATATANISNADMPERLANDEVLIKDYAENAGILASLIDAGIVENTGRWIAGSYVDIPIAKLLVAAQ